MWKIKPRAHKFTLQSFRKRFFSSATINKLDIHSPVPSDLQVAQSVTPFHIEAIAKENGIMASELILYGDTKAKVKLNIRERLGNTKGKLVVVTGITPTPFGEGKTTMACGIHQAMTAHHNFKAFCNIRQPSLGPVFGVKGGAAGGGYSQVIPMDEFNLHLTGDFHAVAAAHNLLGAALDSRLIHEANQSPQSIFKNLCPKKKGKRQGFAPPMLRRLKRLGIDKTDPNTLDDEEIKRFSYLDLAQDAVNWKRVVDMNDRALREIEVGFGEKNFLRKTGFDIASASECMAILALSTSLSDMKERLGRIVVGISRKGEFVTADDVGCSGAMAAIMKDTIHPNLMQSLEGGPVFVHGGPFANIAHGCSSTVADDIALRLVGEEGFVLTEAGFGADIGLEKFMNIKCRLSGLQPDCVVLVATIRALKMHGGGSAVSAGKPLPAEYLQENVELVKNGAKNMQHHIQNASRYGVPVVVCINAFPGDTDDELMAVRDAALEAGALDAVPCKSYEFGGEGAFDVAASISKACDEPSNFELLYPNEMSLEDKIRTISGTYGANPADVTFSDVATQKLKQYMEMGYGSAPICMAKTPLSLSTDPNLKGVPTAFPVHVRDVRLSAGAGFVIAYTGEIMTMPGLTTRPAYFDVDVDEHGKISGLF